MSPRRPRYWSDPLFALAMAAGPLFWLLLVATGTAVSEFDWPVTHPWRFLLPALVYPIVEELVFRGLIQDAIHRRLPAWRIGPLSHANVLTSVLFATLHFVNHPPLWAASVFVPSLIFGFFRDRTGGLAAPVLLHVFYNSGYFWLFTGA